VNDVIFYFGSIIIILAFVWLVFIRFREDDEIDLKKHLWLIVLYIILLTTAIIAWRVIYLIIVFNFQKLINYNNLIQRVNNG